MASVLSVVSDVTLTIDLEGTVLTALVNPNTAPVKDLNSWIGRSLADLMTAECLPKLQRILTRGPEDPAVMFMELNHGDVATWQFPVRYSVHFNELTPDTILLLGRDLHPVAEAQQQLVQAQIALERGYEERRSFNARYRTLMSVVQDAVLLVDGASGVIEDLNERAAKMLGGTLDGLRGKQIESEVKLAGKRRLMDGLAGAKAKEPLTVTAQKTQEPVEISVVEFRAAGEQMMMLRLEANRRIHQSADMLSDNLDLLFRSGLEAIAFTDEKGVIRQANEAFLALANISASSDIQGVSLADVLMRGQVDLSVLLKNAANTTGLRRFSTKLRDHFGVTSPVEISACLLKQREERVIGMIFRHASHVEGVKSADDPSANMHRTNFIDLVGSASLKEIVSRTTDVIERMSIEAAIELTGNNRAAAAEMLGLSRQSLYTKLNKFDLHTKPDPE